jgi:hypothetical protein
MANKTKIWQQSFMGRFNGSRRELHFRSAGFKTFGFAGGRVDVWNHKKILGTRKEWLSLSTEPHNSRYSLEIVN